MLMFTVRDCFCAIDGILIIVTLVSSLTIIAVFVVRRRGLDMGCLQKGIFSSAVASVLVCAMLFLIWVYADGCEVTYVKTAFNRGYTYLPANPECFMERQKTEALISQIKPQYTDVYFLVVGPHGSGKTTVLVDAVRRVGPGIVYVSVSDNDFPSQLAAAFSVNYQCPKPQSIKLLEFWQPIFLWDCSVTMLKRLGWILDTLTTAVKELHAHGEHATLVIDNVDMLLAHQEGEEAIVRLQDYAKKMADMHTLTVVFSASEGQVPSLLGGRSAASRMVELSYFQDITPQKAAEYVQCKYPYVDNHTSAQILSLVGGRFVHLNQAAVYLKLGVSLEQMQCQLLHLVVEELYRLGLASTPCKRDHPLTAGTWAVARNILNAPSGTISVERFDELLMHVPRSEWHQLKTSNVFLIKRMVVSFQSMLVQSFFSTHISREAAVCMEVLTKVKISVVIQQQVHVHLFC